MPVDIGTGAWCRVTQRDRCPVCDSDTWCTVAPNGSAARCKRHESDRPSPGEDGDAWIHRLNGSVDEPGPQGRDDARPKRVPNCNLLNKQYCAAITHDQVKTLATQLGVDPIALGELGIGWCARTDAFSFPMFNAGGDIIGIRHRPRGPGHKFAERGGNNGVFRCRTPNGEGPLFICEGESDLAALLSYGLDGIAVPGTGQCVDVAASFGKGRDVVVIADRDEAGERGAEKLRAKLVEVARSVRVIVPPSPHKDLRAWRQAGATRRDIEQAIAQAARTAPLIEFLRPWQLAELPPRRYVWRDVLAAGDLAMLFGPWGTCKSFITMGLSVAIADCVPFLGFDTVRGTALTICGEGAQGQADRLAGATSVSRMRNRDDLMHAHLAIACSMPALTEPSGFDGTVRAIEAVGKEPSLLIVDTFARAAAATGLDENSTGDTGKLVAALDRLRNMFPGMALLVVHHSGHGNADRARGSSVLPSACDLILRVDQVKVPGPLPQVRLSFDKVKDGRKSAPLLVDFAEVVVRTDDRDLPVTSLRVDHYHIEADENRLPQGKRESAKDRIRAAMLAAGPDGIDFNAGKKVSTRTGATVSEGFARLVGDGEAEPFSGPKGEKRWRLRQGEAP